MVVLQAERTPSGWSELPPDLRETVAAIRASSQQELAGESTTGSLQVVPAAGHNIQVENVPAVIDALEKVLAAAKG